MDAGNYRECQFSSSVNSSLSSAHELFFVCLISPRFVQYDEGVIEDYSTGKPVVTHVNGEEIDYDRVYRVVTKIPDLTNGQSPPWTEYFTEHPELLPPKGAYVNMQMELMTYFARNLWRKIWEALSIELAENCNFMDMDWDCEKCDPEKRLAALDLDGDGEVTVEEMQQGLQDLLGYEVDSREMTLAQFVHNFADGACYYYRCLCVLFLCL